MERPAGFFSRENDVPGNLIPLPEMKPRNNIVYWIQYLTISFILDLQENIYIYIYTKVTKAYYMGPASLADM